MATHKPIWPSVFRMGEHTPIDYLGGSDVRKDRGIFSKGKKIAWFSPKGSDASTGVSRYLILTRDRAGHLQIRSSKDSIASDSQRLAFLAVVIVGDA